MAPDDVDQLVDVGALKRRRDQDDNRSFSAIDRFLIDVLDSRNALEVWHRRLESVLDLIDLRLVIASLGQINRHRPTIYRYSWTRLKIFTLSAWPTAPVISP